MDYVHFVEPVGKGLYLCKCGRCGYEWVSKRATGPRFCAGCNSPYWNKPRVVEVKDGNE